jgi:hypothetical protein
MACVLSITYIRAIKTKKNKIIVDSHTAKAEFIAIDALMKVFLKTPTANVIPNVGKGICIERRLVTVLVYQNGNIIGMANHFIAIRSIGFQAGDKHIVRSFF